LKVDLGGNFETEGFTKTKGMGKYRRLFSKPE
jgi:hypothetical protein